MPRPAHFEIHGSDGEALVRFYTQLFGWTAERWGDEAYWLLDTGTGEGINGAVMTRHGPAPAEGAPVMGAVITVEVDDLDAYMARGLALGATEALARMAVPGMGWAANLKDPDGNVFGVFQPDAEAK